MRAMKKINHLYKWLTEKNNLIKYCKESDVSLKEFNHSKLKNLITNELYSIKELKDNEKFLFLFLYDLKSQQKYLPWINLSQNSLSNILHKSKSTISKTLNSLIKKNLIIKNNIYQMEWKILIINENIETWKVNINVDTKNRLELLRKWLASNNIYLKDLYEENSDFEKKSSKNET